MILVSGNFLNDTKNFYLLYPKKVYVNVPQTFLKDALNNNKVYFILISFEKSIEKYKYNKKEKSSILNIKNLVIEIKGFDKVNLEKLKRNLLKKDYEVGFLNWEIQKKEYLNLIKKIKEEIKKGTFYQVNLTNRANFSFERKSENDLLSLFLNFYKTQKVPYAYLISLKDFFIISGSMELFLKREKEKLLSGPIKGTISIKESIKNLFSEKEKSEHLMIVDIMRNDINLIGKEKKVELFKVEKYSTLYHLVSYIYGESFLDNYFIIDRTLPVASVTGAPKYTACKFIFENEPFNRETYCGISILKMSKDFFVSCVNIRHILGKGNKLSYFSGGGIVYDSYPEKEWEEINLKMKAFLNAI